MEFLPFVPESEEEEPPFLPTEKEQLIFCRRLAMQAICRYQQKIQEIDNRLKELDEETAAR